MNRIHQLDPATSAGKAEPLFTSVEANLGFVPNLMRVLGNSPAALEGYLNLSGSLSGGVLSPQLREQIALAVGEINGCGYCLSAHSLLGNKAGLTSDQILAARKSSAGDEKSDAALKFARSVTCQRGMVADTDLQAVRRAGLSDAEIVEVVQHVALNILTNYTNNVARTVIDFPEVEPGKFESETSETCTTESCGCSH